MSVSEKIGSSHPEGLTAKQEELLDLLFTTKNINGKVTERITLPDGTFKLYSFQRLMAPIDFAQNDREFALKVHETDITKSLSPYFINLRDLPQDLVRRIAVVLYDIDPHEEADFVTGIPKAGVPLAKAFAEVMGIPYIGVFEKEVTEQGRKIILGTHEDLRGKKGIVIDDLVTFAGTKDETFAVGDSLDLRLAMRVLFDREQGGFQRLIESGRDIRAAIRRTQAFPYALRVGHITEAQYRRIEEYHSSQI